MIQCWPIIYPDRFPHTMVADIIVLPAKTPVGLGKIKMYAARQAAWTYIFTGRSTNLNVFIVDVASNGGGANV